MKDAVGLLTDYLIEMEAEDEVGLSIYTHTNSTGAILKYGVSKNRGQIQSTTQQRRAEHYKSERNISAGMKIGRDELVAHACPRTVRLIVLITDGVPNEPTSSSAANDADISEANAAKFKILAISPGSDRDTSLMQQVADITGSEHFDIPGGSTVVAVRDQLKIVFRKIANSRALKLIADR